MASITVVEGDKPPRPSNAADDLWLRRQAVQILAQLPESQADALRVLEHAGYFLKTYLGRD